VADEPKAQESATPTEQQPKVAASQEETTVAGLPDETKERTREQFEKLTSHNKELADALERTQQQLDDYRRRVFNDQRFQEVQPEQPLYDQNTGLINVQALEDLQQRLIKAEVKLQATEKGVTQVSQTVEEKEAFASYPELNRNDGNFNEEFHKLTRAIAMDSMVYPDQYKGNPLTFKEAADLAMKQMKKEEKQEQAQGEKAEEEKEQASLGASGRPSQAVARELFETDDQRLSVGTRLGDKQSMIERMKRIRMQSQQQE